MQNTTDHVSLTKPLFCSPVVSANWRYRILKACVKQTRQLSLHSCLINSNSALPATFPFVTKKMIDAFRTYLALSHRSKHTQPPSSATKTSRIKPTIKRPDMRGLWPMIGQKVTRPIKELYHAYKHLQMPENTVFLQSGRYCIDSSAIYPPRFYYRMLSW